MFKDYRYINAGENEIYRYGRKAVAMVESYLEPNERGYYSFPVDGNKYYTIGTSNGKYGEFCKVNGTIFSVNKGGYMYAKAGTEKGDKFVEALKSIIAEMHRINMARVEAIEEETEEVEEVAEVAEEETEETTAEEILAETFAIAKEWPNKDVELIANTVVENHNLKDSELDRFWDMFFYRNLTYTNPLSGITEFYGDVNILNA